MKKFEIRIFKNKYPYDELIGKFIVYSVNEETAKKQVNRMLEIIKSDSVAIETFKTA